MVARPAVIEHEGPVVVGAGLAGLFTALKMAPRPVTVLSPVGLGEGASSAWAQGGIAAALAEEDSADAHARDTVRAGAGTVDITVAASVAGEAKARIEDLVRLGTPFDRAPNGGFVQSREAAHSAHRVVRVRGDTAGRAIMDSLIEAVRATPAICVVEGVTAQSLLCDGARVAGVVVRGPDGRLAVLSNEGGHVNGQLRMRLVSVMHMAGGIGTRIELRGEGYRATRWARDDLPVEIGLRGLDRIDTVQTVWTTGVVDNQMDVIPGDEPLTVVIYTWADTGSCPFVYTWDGEGFRFVTDLLGSAAIGMPLTRDTFVPINPVEAAVIGGPDALAPRGGDYLVNVTSELREVSYFDRLRLTAVDHPPGVEIHSTDMIQTPPFRPSELWALGARRPLRRAVGDDGVDRTDAVREADGVHGPPGPVLPPPVRGTCLPMSLEMDFGALPTARPLVLALTGWIEYGTASTNIALSQNPSIEVIWPYLEARGGDGEWVTLDVPVGLPAGKNKKVLCDLAGKLPAGADRLRLVTTFELRWDRVALFERVPLDPSAVRDVAFATAELGWRGFSDLRRRGPEQPKTPDWDVVSSRPRWRTSVEGWCTAYGDVRELLAERDGRHVVLGSGDVLELSVPASAFGAVPAGAERTFLISTVGWVREGDVNTDGPATVWPPVVEEALGLEGGDEEDAWRLRYNTRWVAADRFRDAGESP